MSIRSLARVRNVLTAAALALLLTACGSIPQAGTVQAGVESSDDWSGTDGQFLPGGPTKDADPIAVVEGFIGAATSPAANWAVAHSFLHPQFQERWEPDEAVTVDASPGSRAFRIREVGTEWPDLENPTGGVPALNSNAEYEVEVQLSQVGTVDASGAYLSVAGPALQTYRVRQDAAGQWRISEAPNGTVIDEVAFNLVFSAHQLHFYDRTWAYLVPEIRWYPSDADAVTRITEELVSGQPTGWLLGSVSTAFGPKAVLDRTPVATDAGGATIELTEAALALTPNELARMRTQLEASLAHLQISSVQFTVRGRDLQAGQVTARPIAIDGRLIADTEAGFGIVTGGNVTPISGVSDVVAELGEDLVAIDVSISSERAAVLLQDGHVQFVAGGELTPVDERPALLAPSLDTHGFVWSIPAGQPGALQVHTPSGDLVTEIDTFQDAASVRSIQVSADATKLAAVLTTSVGEQLVVAAIVRANDGRPLSLGVPQLLTNITNETIDMIFSGSLAINVLKRDGEQVRLLEQLIGAPSSIIAAPEGAIALQDTGAPVSFDPGYNTGASVRLLTQAGNVLTKRGSSWHTPETGIELFSRHTSGN